VQGLFLVVPAASVQKLETSEPFFPDASNHSDIAKLVMPDGALYKVLKGFVKNSLLGAADADFVERTPLGAADADSKVNMSSLRRCNGMSCVIQT
jgi:hypothetical protein